MKYIIITSFIILCYLSRCFGEAVNILIFTITDNSPYVNLIKDKFPNVNVEIKTIFDSEKDVKSSMENKKYDIYIYDSDYMNILAPYLLDLNKYLPKEHINLYDTKVISEIGTFKNELISLPISLNYEILYSNKYLLDKYNKPIPKTWDELIETCLYIMDKENDPELICYNGLYNESSQGFRSLYSHIYSCRDSYDSPYPDPQDKSFVDSLNMLKKIKNEVASDEIFKSNENYTFNKMLTGKSIFIKYWLISEPLLSAIPYVVSILPGLKSGISGSSITGTNIGIYRDIPNDKKEDVIEVFKYITSKEFQLKIDSIPGITELMDNKDICNNHPCDIIKNIQFTGEPKFIKEGSEENKNNYRNFIYQFLYENKPINETIQEITDTMLYTSSDNDDNSGINCMTHIPLLLLMLNVLSVLLLF